jgi:site-specific DNA recombinase
MDKLFCYLRVSSKRQKDDGNSIERQIALGKRIAKLKGLEYVEMLEGKEGVGSSKRYRPVFQDVLSRIKTGEIKHIWYLDRTRWSRGGEIGSKMEGIEDAYVLHHYLKPNRVSVYEGENGTARTFDTPESQLFDQIQSLFSKMESDKIRHRSVSGKRFVGKKYGSAGRFLGGTVNFGYSNKDKTWVENKTEAKVVKELFQRYSRGQKIKDLKRWLDSENITPRRARSWNLETIRKMLANEIYTGVFTWTSKDTNETFTHTVPQLVSHALFNRVQKVIERNASEERRNNRRKTPTLLDGLLVCGDCGNSVTGKVKLYEGKRPDSKTYSCIVGMKKYQKQMQIDCQNKRSLNMERTDDFVSEVVRKVLSESSTLKESFKQQIFQDRNLKKSEIKSEQRGIEQQIRKLDGQISGTEDSIAAVKFRILQGDEDAAIGEKIVARLLEELENQKQLRLDKIGRIHELNESEEWIDWVNKYLSDTDIKFAKDPKGAIGGIVNKILVVPEFGKGRDGKKLQTGHRLKIHFKLPIVNDSIEYLDADDKSQGYEVRNGKRSINAGSVKLHAGGRPSKKKDLQNNPFQTNSVTVE